MHPDDTRIAKPYVYRRHPAMLYKPDGSTKIVQTPEAEAAAGKDGWTRDACLPPEPEQPAAVLSIEARVATLEEQYRTLAQQIAKPGLEEPDADPSDIDSKVPKKRR